MTSLKSVFEAVRAASRKLNLLDEATINSVLRAVADEAEAQSGYILAENARDLMKMDKNNPKYDRLMLTEQRLADIAADMRRVAELPSPRNN